MLEYNAYKVYVDVDVTFTKEGEMRPSKIHWYDGTEYEVNKIIDVRRAASLKAGGSGIRYMCEVEGTRCSLYYEENYRWFVVSHRKVSELMEELSRANQ